MQFHADCGGCCVQGLCHFCSHIARESWQRSDGVTVRVCATHDTWLKTDQYAPVQGRLQEAIDRGQRVDPLIMSLPKPPQLIAH